MAVSEVAIYNMALDMLEEGPITDPSDDSEAARLMNRNYAISRDEVLRAHPWNFAITRASLPALSAAPAFGWDRCFQLPVDCVRLLPVQKDGAFNGASVPHVVEGRKILTNAQAPLPIRYVAAVEDTGLFDALFTRAVAARLATYVGHVLTGKQSYIDRVNAIYKSVLGEARKIDGQEGTPESPYSDDWVEARY